MTIGHGPPSGVLTLALPGTAEAAPSAARIRVRWPDARLAMDITEKAIALVLLLGAGAAIAASGKVQPLALVFLAPNLLVLLLVLVRRRAQIVGEGVLDWSLPLAASVAPQLLVAISAPPIAPPWVALGCMVLGALLSFAAMVCIGKSFGIFPANRGVKQNGPYGVIRHPMYLGYALWQLGFVLANPGPANAVVLIVALGLQVWRIEREERVLSTDPAHGVYRSRVRAKLVPLVY